MRGGLHLLIQPLPQKSRQRCTDWKVAMYQISKRSAREYWNTGLIMDRDTEYISAKKEIHLLSCFAEEANGHRGETLKKPGHYGANIKPIKNVKDERDHGINQKLQGHSNKAC